MYWVIFCISCQSTVVHCSMSFIQCSLKLFKQRKFFYFLWECLPQTEDLAVKGCFQMFNLHYAHFPAISAEVPFLMFMHLRRTLPSWSLQYCLFSIQTKDKSLGMSRKCQGRMVTLHPSCQNSSGRVSAFASSAIPCLAEYFSSSVNQLKSCV